MGDKIVAQDLFETVVGYLLSSIQSDPFLKGFWHLSEDKKSLEVRSWNPHDSEREFYDVFKVTSRGVKITPSDRDPEFKLEGDVLWPTPKGGKLLNLLKKAEKEAFRQFVDTIKGVFWREDLLVALVDSARGEHNPARGVPDWEETEHGIRVITQFSKDFSKSNNGGEYYYYRVFMQPHENCGYFVSYTTSSCDFWTTPPEARAYRCSFRHSFKDQVIHEVEIRCRQIEEACGVLMSTLGCIPVGPVSEQLVSDSDYGYVLTLDTTTFLLSEGMVLRIESKEHVPYLVEEILGNMVDRPQNPWIVFGLQERVLYGVWNKRVSVESVRKELFDAFLFSTQAQNEWLYASESRMGFSKLSTQQLLLIRNAFESGDLAAIERIFSQWVDVVSNNLEVPKDAVVLFLHRMIRT